MATPRPIRLPRQWPDLRQYILRHLQLFVYFGSDARFQFRNSLGGASLASEARRAYIRMRSILPTYFLCESRRRASAWTHQ